MRRSITRPVLPVARLREVWRCVPIMTVSIAASALLLAGAIGRYGPAGPEVTATPTPAAGLADYTVTAKTLYKNASQNFGKFGYYVTIILDGEERERPTSASCYAAARVEGILAENCR